MMESVQSSYSPPTSAHESNVVRIEQRLNLLPKQVARKLNGYLEIKHLTYNQIELVLDAGEVAIDNSKLDAFALSYFALEASGVPVRDTINLARLFSLKINLWATPTQWKMTYRSFRRQYVVA
ncbi:hypothetical protein [uncultured Umboniibacter sp.]|uniref:hypothetical protein n=1 Tax=uncultured Umboniibacter sp. TaxID=1798917 RepID=UPI002630A6E8|nr:hypothetical protein [uncultured Umboniibacter sp.]